MAQLAVNLFGTFRVTLDDEPVTGMESDKVRALLAYLAVEGDRPQRREILAGLLWPDMAERDARTNLRQALANLRKVLGDRDSEDPLLNVTRQTIQFNRQPDLVLDVQTFADAINASVSHPHDSIETCKTCVSRLHQAVAVYQGAFLEGFSLDSDLFEEWLVVQRERYHIQLLDALDHLTAYHLHKGDYAATQRYAQRQVELEPWRESAHRQLMRTYAQSGNRGMALAQYEMCRQVLQNELGIDPEIETTALYEAIRRGDIRAAAVTEMEAQVPELTTDYPVPDMTASLTPISSPDVTHRKDERRFVTALVATLKVPNMHAGEVDLETWVEVMHNVVPLLETEANRFGGEVNQVRNDGLLVLFGLRAVHEDDPERAVLTALAMQKVFKNCITELPEMYNLHVGISTGEVIATSLDDQHVSGTALGQVTALAERMADAAEAGTVLVAEATYRLVASLFEWQKHGRFQVQGVREPVEVYRPLMHKAHAMKGRGIEGLVSSLVGRDAEVQKLQAAIDHLRAGMGGIVTVVGEAGVGKSRLVTEVKSTQSEANLNWYEGRCLSYATNVAYQVWTDMLRSWLESTADTSPESMVETIKARVLEICPDTSGEVYPFLVRLLSLPLDEASEARVRGIDADGIQVLTFRAVETFIECLSQQRPLVLVFEDLHWAAPTSLVLLEKLLSLTDRTPLLLVCVMRPVTEHGSWQLKELAAREYPHRYTDLQLVPLNSGESETLMGNLLVIEDLPGDLRTRILGRAEGNPLFLEEILRALIEDEAIVYESVTDTSTGIQTGRWVAESEIEDLCIPDTLYGVLAARIDRLESQTKRVLQVASVIGRTFSYPLLSEIIVNGDSDGLDTHLITLQRAQLIREKAWLPEREYIFKHVLTQEAAYNGLLRKERRAIHSKVAESIEWLYPGHIDERLGLLAYHWEQAGDKEQAVKFLKCAGEQAAMQYANAEAVDYFSRALALVPDADIQMRYNLLLSREKVFDLLGKRDTQAEDIGELTVLAAQLDADMPKVGKSYQAEAGLRRTNLAIRRGQYKEAKGTAQEILQFAQEARDVSGEAAAYREWGRALYYELSLADAVPILKQALAIARKANLRQVVVDTLHSLGTVYYNMGHNNTLTTYEQALKVCQEIGDRNRQAIVLRDLSYTLINRGDYNGALSYAEQSLRVCHEIGNRRDEGWAQITIGSICFCNHLSSSDEIEKYAMNAKKIFYEVQDMVGIEKAYVLLQDNAERQDDDARVLRFAEQAVNTFRRAGSQRHEGSALVKVGFFLLKRHRYTEAQLHLERAYQIMLESKISGLQFYPINLLGMLFFALGDYKDARIYFRKSLAISYKVMKVDLKCSCLVNLAFTSHAAGDDETGHRYGEQALITAQDNDLLYWQGLANLALGHALTALGKWDAATEAYTQVFNITEDAGIILEARTGLTRLKLLNGEYLSALAFVKDIMCILQQKPPRFYNLQEPFRIYLTCFHVLEANQDPCAQQVLAQAYNLLMERAATIEDEALHRSYLENVAENREIVALWERLQMDKDV